MNRWRPTPRLAIAGGLIIAAVITAGLAALVGGPQEPPAPTGGASAPTSVAANTSAPAASQGEVQPTGPGGQPTGQAPPTDQDSGDDTADDSVATDTHVPSPATIATGPVDPAEAAAAFLVKFLNTQGKSAETWRASFADLVTEDLRALLADTDIEAVPAGRVPATGVTAELIGDQVAEVTVPLTGGPTVVLTLVGVTGRWVVSELAQVAR